MKNLVQILNKFKDKKILVLGDVLLDLFTYGDTNRINPEHSAVPLLTVREEKYILGGAANVAHNITSLGAECDLCGVIGDDKAGHKVEKLCDEGKIGFYFVHENSPTITKERLISLSGGKSHYLSRIDRGEGELKKIQEQTKKEILEILEKNISKYDFVILSDYDKGFFDQDFSQKIIKLAKENKILTIVDPKPRETNFFKGCYAIRPNKYDAEKITGIKYENGNALEKMAVNLGSQTNAEKVIITCGGDGAVSYDTKTREFMRVETKAIEIADPTGAGDTSMATIALALASGANLHEATILANYASGVVVGKIGTAVPTIEEIKERIKLDKLCKISGSCKKSQIES